LGLQQVMHHWNDIAAELAERNRKRIPKLEGLSLS
jgi:hypothetical protein